MENILQQAVSLGKLRQIDRQAGLFVERMAGGNKSDLLLVSSLVSHAVGQGHICLPLSSVAGQQVFAPEIFCQAPGLDHLRNSLMQCDVVGKPGEMSLLVLDDDDRCYFSRYYDCEKKIGRDLQRRSKGILPVDFERAAALLKRLFSPQESVDWQQQAAAVALLKQFAVISGGPGTGKTYTVARILALLQALDGGKLRIGLAAPTGKAAARLHESIQKTKESMEQELAGNVPDETKTVHRLLGYRPDSGTFRYNRDNQLHLDLLVLDESSMIDVPLMASLVEALPPEARLVMLGDRDQLTSVEVGSLFGDICSGVQTGWSAELCDHLRRLTPVAPDPVTGEESFADSVVVLRDSFRFSAKSGISNFARAVNRGTHKSFEQPDQYDDIIFHDVQKDEMGKWLGRKIIAGFRDTFAAADPLSALASLSRFRILCAVRDGVSGVTGVNDIAEKTLRDMGMISQADEWYTGRPVMIKRNHYGLHLFNGDTGILWPDEEGRMWAWFQYPDGSMHPVAPVSLPEHETAFAITVHKSQGSEFEEVVFLLPSARSRVLNRELIYTAVTRARRMLTVCGDIGLLEKALENRVIRFSGLTDKLWNG